MKRIIFIVLLLCSALVYGQQKLIQETLNENDYTLYYLGTDTPDSYDEALASLENDGWIWLDKTPKEYLEVFHRLIAQIKEVKHGETYMLTIVTYDNRRLSLLMYLHEAKNAWIRCLFEVPK